MKTLGLIGGMSWESTLTYYRIINQYVSNILDGLHSAQLIIWSFDFEEIAALQAAGDWESAAKCLSNAGNALKAAGAEGLVICTNTMHKVAQEVEKNTRLPLLHIADATGKAIHDASLNTVGLLGTRFTMEQDFYTQWLDTHYSITTLTPDKAARDTVHTIIYDELCKGILTDQSKAYYKEIIRQLQASGAQAIILGCTEIGLLVQQDDSMIPLFDTTALHAKAAAEWMLG